MKRPDSTEQALDALRIATDISPFLKNRSPRVVAQAADRAARMTSALAPDLVEAFRRLLRGGAKLDPGCVAKLAIVKALIELEDPAAEVYFAGANTTQLEASWGEPIDTAAELRGVCAIGMARMAHPDALLEAVRLLSDKTAESRTGALRALADSGRPEAELVLRYKADCGDHKPEVEAECFAAVLRLGPRSRAVPFVANFMTRGVEEAAIALGESRMPEAWPALRDAFPRSHIAGAILLGMSLLRNDEAIEFLFIQTDSAVERVAAVAIEALATYREDQAIRNRMEQLIARKNSLGLLKAFQKSWG